MYVTLLTLHSLIRWFVLISLIVSIYLAYRGWLKKRPYTKSDRIIRIVTVSIAHTQLAIGLWLYYISPIVDYFLHNFKESVHQTQLRFFGMEHITMMLIAMTLITAGAGIARRKKIDKDKFKSTALWYSVALLIIFTSIPWEFSPFTSRPYFRFFE